MVASAYSQLGLRRGKADEGRGGGHVSGCPPAAPPSMRYKCASAIIQSPPSHYALHVPSGRPGTTIPSKAPDGGRRRESERSGRLEQEAFARVWRVSQTLVIKTRPPEWAMIDQGGQNRGDHLVKNRHPRGFRVRQGIGLYLPLTISPPVRGTAHCAVRVRLHCPSALFSTQCARASQGRSSRKPSLQPP
jgi:hypothetical protein